MSCLEMFGGSGDLQMLDYAKHVKSIEAWEIDANAAGRLKQSLPDCNVRVVDTYDEAKRHACKYDLVMIDNPASTYGVWCEHFGLFPAVFGLTSETAVVILTVIPTIGNQDRQDYPYLFNDEQLAWRRRFYRTANPANVPFEEMVAVYAKYAAETSYTVDWWFTERRSFMHYLALGISRKRR
jgi:hypothetical protein